MRASDKIARAKTGLVLMSPFYASLMMSLETVVDNRAPTAYTDGIVIGYNEGYINSIELGEVKSLLAHEVLHVALEHVFRGKGRDHGRWNRACDYVINDMLKKDDYMIGKDWLYDPKYSGLTAEQVYGLLEDKSDDSKSESCPWHIESGDEGDPESGSCESGYDPSNPGEVRQYPEDGKSMGKGHGKSPTDARKEWHIKITQAEEISSGWGSMPAGLKRSIREILNPVIPWESTLSRFMIENTRNDYSWARQSGRYIHAGIYMPAMQTPSLGNIVVAVDTSGSVTERNLSEYAAEIRSILMIAPDTGITVVYVDTKVAHVDELSINDLELSPHGGGGTDYTPAFEYVDNRGEDVTCLIYFTDGYCYSFPKNPPHYPTLWVVDGNTAFRPPFGEVVLVNNKQER